MFICRAKLSKGLSGPMPRDLGFWGILVNKCKYQKTNQRANTQLVVSKGYVCSMFSL